MATTSLINGKPCDFLAIDDRGLAYGDGLFETIAVTGGQPQLLGLHLRRLEASCVRLAISLDSASLKKELALILAEAARDHSYVLKITVTRESAGRGYSAAELAGSTRILQLLASDKDYSSLRAHGVRVRYCDTMLPINPRLAGMKHLCRLENVLARSEWRDEAIFEGLMSDYEGYVTEGVMSNLFIAKDGLLITPHLDRCGVVGVMQEFILANLAPLLQLPVSKDRLLAEQINSADEVFISNSLIGIVPVVAVGQFTKSVGPITRQLQQSLAEALHA